MHDLIFEGVLRQNAQTMTRNNHTTINNNIDNYKDKKLKQDKKTNTNLTIKKHNAKMAKTK